MPQGETSTCGGAPPGIVHIAPVLPPPTSANIHSRQIRLPISDLHSPRMAAGLKGTPQAQRQISPHELTRADTTKLSLAAGLQAIASARQIGRMAYHLRRFSHEFKPSWRGLFLLGEQRGIL
ncbi:uncharacterized protein STEHIDRAFT_113416 [Stereum hirsutum FP-91666 SS1]|uniref:uncharacterized protein n=1 Tax=Stereum hirsutum (strain FP-91666) TaxID=721885 RepID=UPI000444A620|nr:uncharacterized protein STEHIDRAFT_113416 [Stereum hirsutum FP-91666 SS1]EIM83250.1 hypothetical protein STEHIDRAFT_113416 [Stereum hirsutum FP-91666 SS1]